jgi:protein-S-isoprenylcysteine O-methyltransferase Ste14
VRDWLQTAGWIACVVYSTIPVFWLMIHPFAERWRARQRSPYVYLVPVWITLWFATGLLSSPWRRATLYFPGWSWIPGMLLFAAGLYLYVRSSQKFSARQLSGIPELHRSNGGQRLVTGGIRARVRHPVYLAHLCEMLAWSVGTGLAVCWALTAVGIVTGALMIRMEDAELDRRFGAEHAAYRRSVPAFMPKLRLHRPSRALLLVAVVLSFTTARQAPPRYPTPFEGNLSS